MEWQCWDCNKKANYRDKKGGIYCSKCYWNLEENKEKKKDRSERTYDGTDVYVECPFCGAGDLCEWNNCSRKCPSCQIINLNKSINGYCSQDCQEEAQDKNDEKIGQQLQTLFQETISLQEKEPKDFTVDDKQKLQNLQQRTENLSKQKANSAMLKGDIKSLQEALAKLGQEVKEVNHNPNKPKPHKEKERQRERERERERANLEQAIANLETKLNRTEEENQDLADKKEQLAQLNNKPYSNTENKRNHNPWLLPTLVISGLGIIALITLLIFSKKKK